MSKPNEVQGRPFWARDEPVAVQRLIVAQKFTQLGLKSLREFAADPGAPRRLPHSVARHLADRGLGEITGKQRTGSLTRAHPKADFQLNRTGLDMLARVIATRTETADAAPEIGTR